jgi:dihydroorotate dehydrogenase/Pyruvate/2-oxoacid:ferredoxin oxidoreductase delta subunit
MGLETRFAGLHLRSPIIAASAPPTESVAAIRACVKAGVGAVVTKSIVDFRRADFGATPRRVHHDRPRHAFSISGSFNSETLTLDEGVRLVSEAKSAVDVPVIASVGVLDPTRPDALETARRLIAAGADMIHFDLFYLPQPRATDEALAALVQLFDEARASLSGPFGAKFNLDFPPHLIAHHFAPGSADAWFLLDSIRTPPPLSGSGESRIANLSGSLETSQFGAWQKPITLQYARVLADAGFAELCVGGGLASAEDILEAVMLGAGSVQIATQIMIKGYDWIRRTNDRLEALLGGGALEDVRGRALRVRDVAAPDTARKVVAVVQPQACTNCGVCTRLVFCPFIQIQGERPPTIDQDCYGCGLCETLCPVPGAILMEPAA